MKKRILAPNANYSGISAGVQFSHGVGEAADSHLIQWFAENGYQIDNSGENLKDESFESLPDSSNSPGELHAETDLAESDAQSSDKNSATRKVKRSD